MDSKDDQCREHPVHDKNPSPSAQGLAHPRFNELKHCKDHEKALEISSGKLHLLISTSVLHHLTGHRNENVIN